MRRGVSFASFLVLLLFTPFLALAEPLVEGENYIVVNSSQATDKDKNNKAEVREFFWYGCPHCYSLEPYLDSWLTKNRGNINFVRTPAVLGHKWLPHAKAYYALRAMGESERNHRRFFDAIHKDRIKLKSEEQIAEFFAVYGIPRDELMSSMNSMHVNLEIKNSHKLARNYRLRGVPSFVVGGKYMTSPSMMKECSGQGACYRKFFSVIDALVEKAGGKKMDEKKMDEKKTDEKMKRENEPSS